MSTIKLTASDLCTLASDEGCNVKELKTFFKVTAPTNNRKAIYIAKSKKVVTRVDFSGFEPEESEHIQALTKEEAKELHLGAVRGMMITKNLRCDEEEYLQVIEAGIAQLLSEEEGFKLAPRKPKTEEVIDPTEGVDFEALAGLNLAADEE